MIEYIKLFYSVINAQLDDFVVVCCYGNAVHGLLINCFVIGQSSDRVYKRWQQKLHYG